MTAAAAAPESASLRLDIAVAERQGISRSAAQQLIAAGRVRVDGRLGRAGERLRPGQEVVIDTTPPAAAGDEAGPPVDVCVVWEDKEIAIVDKPAGLVVHPAAGHPHGTLADGLRQRGSTWSIAGGAERPGIVHRLDRDTSGLLVVAKTDRAHRRLAAQLADRTLGRIYWAMVHGGFREASGRIDAPLGRDPRDRKRMAVVAGGREAITDFTVVQRFGPLSLLEVRLRTGRTHQIRVHMASIGHPIAGDPVYGRRGDTLLGRPALHAQELHLVHPTSGAEMTFTSPLPDDLAALLQRCAEAAQ